MRTLLPALLLLASLLPAAAHEMRPAFLQIVETAPENYDVLWKVPAKGTDQKLSLRVVFADDVETVGEPVAGIADGAYLERWKVKRPGGLAGTPVKIDGLVSTFTDTLVRVELLDTDAQSVLLKPDRPGFVVAEKPSSWTVAGTYFWLGVEHILLGIDHLLFVLALLLVVKRRWALVKTITAFTVAHSITLALATLGFVNMPGPPVEAIIALSIVFVAAEIVHGQNGHPGLTARAPWIVAFTFGLLHGFGFAGALSEVGLPGSAIPIALLTFNVGVEAGQLAFVLAVLVIHEAIRKLPFQLPSWPARIPPYAIGGIAAFWTIERVVGLGIGSSEWS